MERGELVPDAVVIGVAEERLRAARCEDGLRARRLPAHARPGRGARRDARAARACELDRCLALVVDEDELVARLLRRAEIEGRADDNETTIRKRMRVYRSRPSR